MKKKKITVFILTFVLIGIFHLVKNGMAYDVYVWYFNTDKDTYYNDEEIHINASWDLDYDPGNEESYIQIKIYDKFDNFLWNSAKYEQIGTHLTGEWNVRIQDLNLPFNNTMNKLFIRFYYYLFSGFTYVDFLETLEVQAAKRNVSCELIDFKPNIEYGDVLQFKARFYSSENNSNLANHLISVSILSDNIIRYTNNFTTNSSGMIEIIIPTSENITIGRYNLKFEIMGDTFYEKSSFEYQLSVVSKLENESSLESTDSKEKDNIYSNILPFIFSILSISLLALLIIYHSNFKKTKQKDLADLTFRF